MIVILIVVFFDRRIDKAFRGKILRVQRCTNDSAGGLGKCQRAVELDGREPGFPSLVDVTSGVRSAVVKYFPPFFGEKRETESVALVHKGKGVPRGAHEAKTNIYSPQYTKPTPRSGHGVPPVLRTGGNQHPLVADQIEYIVNACLDSWYTRRSQAITWMPTVDPDTYDPPCLQRIWCRVGLEDDGAVLNMNAHWRSRDLYKAWFMNAYALTDLQRVISASIEARWDRPVRVGRYVDISDSLHIYGSYFKEIGPEIEKMRASPDYRSRAWPSDHPTLNIMIEETRQRLAENPDFMRSD